MRHLSQSEAQSERDFFSKKKSGKFILTNRREETHYPPQFMVTGYDNFDSGVLGLARSRHTTHIKVKLNGDANLAIAVKFVCGHYERGKLISDYVYSMPTHEGANEANIRISRKDFGIIFILDRGTTEPLTGNEKFIKVEGEFEFVEIKRFLLFSRFLSRFL